MHVPGEDAASLLYAASTQVCALFEAPWNTHLDAQLWARVSAPLSALWIACLWQGLVVVACAALLDRAMPRLAARVRHGLWLLACAVCALLPLADWTFSRARVSVDSAVAGMPPVHAGFSPLLLGGEWSCAIALVWAAGALWAMARLATGLVAVRSLLRHATPPANASRIAPTARTGSRGEVRILLSDEALTPVATGYLRPAVVLPRALAEALTPEQLDQVLRHELEHLARRDDWTVLLAGCLGCLLPLHPALAWAKRKLGETREQACDDAVLRAASPRAYALSLAQIAECAAAQNRLRFLPGLLGERSQLAGRIEHILAARTAPAKASRAALPLTIGAMAALTLALGQMPQFVAFRVPSPQGASLPGPVLAAAAAAPKHPLVRTTNAPRLVAAGHVLEPQPTLAHAIAQRVHRHPAMARAHALLATADVPQAPVVAPLLPTLTAQPSAIFVLWTPRRAHAAATEFVTAVVFEFAPAQGSEAGARQYLSILEI